MSLFIIFPISSTVYLLSYWDTLIYFFLLHKILMVQPAYAQPGRCHTDTKNICYSFVGGCVLYLVSVATSFQVYHSDALFLFQAQNGIPW